MKPESNHKETIRQIQIIGHSATQFNLLTYLNIKIMTHTRECFGLTEHYDNQIQCEP